MDDRQQARQKRGQTSAGKYASIAGLSDSELIRGLEDVDPQTRTAAARLLGNESAVKPFRIFVPTWQWKQRCIPALLSVRRWPP